MNKKIIFVLLSTIFSASLYTMEPATAPAALSEPEIKKQLVREYCAKRDEHLALVMQFLDRQKEEKTIDPELYAREVDHAIRHAQEANNAATNPSCTIRGLRHGIEIADTMIAAATARLNPDTKPTARPVREQTPEETRKDIEDTTQRIFALTKEQLAKIATLMRKKHTMYRLIDPDLGHVVESPTAARLATLVARFHTAPPLPMEELKALHNEADQLLMDALTVYTSLDSEPA